MKHLIMQPSQTTPPPSPSSGTNILLSTLNICFSLSVRDQESHPYKTTGTKFSFSF